MKTVVIDSLEGGELLSDFFYVDLNSEVSTINWVKCNGTEYLTGMYVCVKTQMDMPIFRKIRKIIINDQAFLLTCIVDTLYFDDHFNAYCVEDRADSLPVFFC